VDPLARQDMADAMSRHAGVLRQGEGLEHLIELLSEVPAAPGRLDLEVVEATNLHTVSMLVATAALARTESRGCHRRSDLPERDPAWERRVARRWIRGSIDSVAEISA
jgi:L-aspartate oxidase